MSIEDLRNRDRIRARKQARGAGLAAAGFAVVFGLLLWRSENAFIKELTVYSDDKRNLDPALSLLLSRMALARSLRMQQWFQQDPTPARNSLQADISASRLRGEFEMHGHPCKRWRGRPKARSSAAISMAT